MLTSAGLSLGILLLALVSKVLKHKERSAAENQSVCVYVCGPAMRRGRGGGPTPITAAASSVAE